jgi:MFS family permease
MTRPTVHPDTPVSSLWPLLVPVYAPGILLGSAQGAVVPFTPLLTTSLGGSIAAASAITAVRGLGTMASDIPAGRLMSRLGDRRAMLVGSLVMLAGLVGSALSPDPWLLGVSSLVYGAGWAMWMLSRVTLISAIVTPEVRGRALSALGATSRVGALAGPLAASFVVHELGLHHVFYLAAVMTALGAVCFMVGPEHDLRTGGQNAKVKISAVVKQSPKTFAVIGSGSLMVSAMRGSRQVVIPLWAEHVGVSPSMTGIIFGVSAAVDLLVSYPSGVLSDRWDRRASAVPCLTLLGLGQIALLMSHTSTGVLLASLVIGVGNGFGSGIVMTLGTDLAPVRGRAQFLAVWRLVSDTGLTVGPLYLSALTALVGFVPSAGSLALLAVSAGVMFQRSDLLKGPSSTAPPPTDVEIGPAASETTL